jgi:hypothetical protein
VLTARTLPIVPGGGQRNQRIVSGRLVTRAPQWLAKSFAVVILGTTSFTLRIVKISAVLVSKKWWQFVGKDGMVFGT